MMTLSTAQQSLILAMFAMVLLTALVAFRMLYMRVQEMKRERIHPQAIDQSFIRSQTLKDARASDNYNHLFEMPILFYVLCLAALASGTESAWLASAVWGYVVLRVIHSWIQCTYNRVMHRFNVFVLSFVWLIVLWVSFILSVMS